MAYKCEVTLYCTHVVDRRPIIASLCICLLPFPRGSIVLSCALIIPSYIISWSRNVVHLSRPCAIRINFLNGDLQGILRITSCAGGGLFGFYDYGFGCCSMLMVFAWEEALFFENLSVLYFGRVTCWSREICCRSRRCDGG